MKTSEAEQDLNGRRSVTPEPPVDYSPVKTPPASPTSLHPPYLEPPSDDMEPEVSVAPLNRSHSNVGDHNAETDAEYSKFIQAVIIIKIIQIHVR